MLAVSCFDRQTFRFRSGFSILIWSTDLRRPIRHVQAIAERRIRRSTISIVANTSRSKPEPRSPTSTHGPMDGRSEEICFISQRFASSQVITMSGRFSTTAQMRTPTTNNQVQNRKKWTRAHPLTLLFRWNRCRIVRRKAKGDGPACKPNSDNCTTIDGAFWSQQLRARLKQDRQFWFAVGSSSNPARPVRSLTKKLIGI